MDEFLFDQMAPFFFIFLDQLLMERLSEILQCAATLFHHRLVPPSWNRISPIEKPSGHFLRTAPSPVRQRLLRLDVLEPSLLEVVLDLLGGRPFRARDYGCFELRMHTLAGFGPRESNARVVRIGPGGYT